MPSGFAGLPAEGLAFFAALERHNRREWFQPRKATFDDQVKQPMRELVVAINGALQRFAPDYITDPDKAIYRIYRDTRFSADKTPYKIHIAASLPRRGIISSAGFYFAVSHKEVAVGGGIYMPEKEMLASLRAHFAEHHAEFRKIIAARGLRQLYGDVQGERLTRTPKGFPAGHPADDLLRLKQCYYYKTYPPEMATTPELYTEIVKHLRALTPFVEYLNVHLAGKRPRLSLE